MGRADLKVQLGRDLQISPAQFSAGGSQRCGRINLDRHVQRVTVQPLLDLREGRGQRSLQLCGDTAGVESDAEVDLSDRGSHTDRLSAWPADQSLVNAVIRPWMLTPDSGSVIASTTVTKLSGLR